MLSVLRGWCERCDAVCVLITVLFWLLCTCTRPAWTTPRQYRCTAAVDELVSHS